MKLKYCLMAIFLLGAMPATAAIDPDFDTAREMTGCILTEVQSASLKVTWNELARRFYFASMEAMEDPSQFIQVRGEIQAEIKQLRRVFGHHCVRSIG